MKRQILINATSRETRVALLEDDVLVELMLERPDSGRIVGNIYLGRVEGVLPGIQAAFVDIGSEKAAFLHVSDLADEDPEESDEEKGVRRYPPIQTLTSKGAEILVQVTKEPIGTKGPRVTAQVSLPGRNVVYMPRSEHIGISRKIENREERTRLRRLVRDTLPANAGGVIVRTVTPFGDSKRCQHACGTTTSIPPFISNTHDSSSMMMVRVVAPSRTCTSSSPFGWRSQGLTPSKLPAKIPPPRNGARVAKAASASASGVCLLRPLNTGSPANAALMSTAWVIPLSPCLPAPISPG